MCVFFLLSHPNTVKYLNTVPSSAVQAVPKQRDLLRFYFSQRVSLVKCMCVLFRLSISEDMNFSAAAKDTVERLLKDNSLMKAVISQYELYFTLDLPPHVTEDFRLCTMWADQYVREQQTLLELLYLIFYCGPVLAGPDFYTKGQQDHGPVFQVAELIHKQQFGRVQPLITYLSEEGHATLERVRSICVLIIMKLFDCRRLLSAWRTASEGDSKAGTAILENHAMLASEGKDGKALFLKFDALYFESERWLQEPMHGPVSLTWSLFLAIYFEFREINERESGGANTFKNEKNAIRNRINAAFEFQPFVQMVRILDTVDDLVAQVGPQPLSSSYIPYKDTLRETLWAFFLSNVYAAVSAHLHETTAVHALLCRIFSGAPELADQVWIEVRSDGFCPLLTESQAAYQSSEPVSFLRLLCALTGQASSFSTEQSYNYGSSLRTIECAENAFSTFENVERNPWAKLLAYIQTLVTKARLETLKTFTSREKTRLIVSIKFIRDLVRPASLSLECVCDCVCIFIMVYL
jgi:hypothetical protein